MAIYFVPGSSAITTNVLSNGDRLYLRSGGVISDFRILYGGNLYVSAGGSATDIVISSGGNVTVNPGGVTSDVIINYGGVLTVSSGGSVSIAFNPWSGTVNVAEGAIVTYQEAAGVYYGATDVGLVSMAVGASSADRVMSGLDVANGRSAFVINGGILQNAKTTSHGTILVAQGGYASATVINNKGSMEVSSGGSALEVDVKEGGALTISQAGSAGDITISSGGALYVQNNGHLTGDTFVNRGGYFNGFTFAGNVNIYNGADAIVLQNAANAVVMNTVADLWNNQTAIGAKISRGANLQIHSGGLASSAHVQELGTINVYAGGVASGTLMTGSRHATIERNKSSWVYCNFADYFTGVTTTVAAGTHEFLYNTNVYIFSSGSLEDSPYAEFPGQITGTHLDANEMVVHNGGSALDTAISSGGVLKVDGGYASKTFLEGTRWDAWNYYYTVTKKEEQGRTTYESKLASSARFSGGIDSSYAHVMNGGVVVATELGSYGGLYISNAGTADYTFINDSGSAHVLSGGLASHTNIYSRGNLYVSRGGTADRTFVKSGGSMNVLEGGVASNTFVNSMGYAYISNGGVADESLILLAGSMFVNNGGIISNTIVNSGGKLFVSAGGTAHIAYMPSGWMGEITAGANASVTYSEKPAAGVYYGGDAYGLIYKNDYLDASRPVVDSSSEENKQIRFDFTSGQSALVFSGGSFTSGTISNTGALYVYEGGKVTHVTARAGATINGFSIQADNTEYEEGLQISCAVVSAGVSASLFGSGYAADQVWVNAGGSVFVESGAVISNTDIAAYAYMEIASGATHRGALNITNGATVTMESGSDLVFAIENWDAANGVLINDLGAIRGAPNFSISVDDEQVHGVYELARNVSFADGTELAFTIIGTDVEAALVVNGTGLDAAYCYGETFYQLTMDGTTLKLEVTDEVLLDLYIDVTADVTAPTTDSVTLTVDFADFAVVRKYSLDNGENWININDGGSIVVEQNMTVKFYAEDRDGNRLDTVTYIVSNIDNMAPVIYHNVDDSDPDRPVITAWADDGAGSGVASFEYRIGSGSWKIYTGDIVITQNTSVEFRAVDKLGNESTSRVNIGDITPVPLVSVDDYELGWTNENIVIEASFQPSPGGSPLTGSCYRIDSGEWINYTGPVVITENCFLEFMATDGVNVTIKEINISNIDKEAPLISNIVAFSDTENPEMITVSADFFDNCESSSDPAGILIKEYKIDYADDDLPDVGWTAYVGGGVVISAGGTIYFRATDGAGNSTTSSINVNNIVQSNAVNVYNGTTLVRGGAVLTHVDLGEGFSMVISAGGVASGTTITSGGAVHVYSGGSAVDTVMNSDSYLGIGAGAVAFNTTIQNGGELIVWEEGVVTGNTLNTYGALILSSGAIARETVIESNGGLHVYAGGIASETTVKMGGFFGVGSDAKVYNTHVTAGGAVTIWGGGIAYYNTLDTYGALILSSGAAAKTTYVSSGGGLHVYNGAEASSTTVFAGGFLGIGDGGRAINTVIAENGSLTVWGGGLADVSFVNNNGALILSSGAVANSTTLLAGGGLHIYDGATAYTTFVTSGAALGVGLGGTLWNSEIDRTASVTFYDSAFVRGWNEFAGDVSVQGNLDGTGSMIAFMICERSTADVVIIDDLSGIQGASYYITVDSDMAAGKYLLAGNAGDFDGYITITGTAEKLTCGGRAVTVNGYSYTLRLDRNDNLYVNVVRNASTRNLGDALFPAEESPSLQLPGEEGFEASGCLDGEEFSLTDFVETPLACGASAEVLMGKDGEREILLGIA